MNIVDPIKFAMLRLGAAPVLWLMLLLSAASLAVMLERAWFFARTRADIGALVNMLSKALRQRDLDAARDLLAASSSIEAAVVGTGLKDLQLGAAGVREAMAGAALLQRARLERRLNYLGTLANNAPFIGLFGTVIGIIMAFDQLGMSRAQASASAAVMASIAEALVTTAIGIGIAVPAVAAFNSFQKYIQRVQEQTSALGHVLLAHLEGDRGLRAATHARESLLREATAALARQTAAEDA